MEKAERRRGDIEGTKRGEFTKDIRRQVSKRERKEREAAQGMFRGKWSQHPGRWKRQKKIG